MAKLVQAHFSFLLWLVSVAILYYIYHGYLLVLRVAARATGRPAPDRIEAPLPSVSILLTVHNEQDRVGRCLDGLLALDYNREQLEILVASDGSTDRTNEIVDSYVTQAPIRLFVFDRLGKSEAQNRAIQRAKGDIVAFVDADCLPARDYLRELVRPFADEKVGCVTANLRMAKSGDGVAREQGYYWNYELRLRQLESRLGILAVASGSAMAVRRSSFVPLPRDVGEDCMIPLDVVLQGLKVVHASAALASDSMESDPSREFRARIRMTLRNWTGTWRRPALLNPLSHPGYAFSLWSHKVLRWLSPIFVLVASISSLGLIGHPFVWPVPILTFLFFALAAIGWVNQLAGIKIPFVGVPYGFCLANLGFLVGIVKALAGRSMIAYTNRK